MTFDSNLVYVVTYGPRAELQPDPERPLGDYHDARVYTRLTGARFAAKQCMEEHPGDYVYDAEAAAAAGAHCVDAWSSETTTVWLERLSICTDEGEPGT